MGENSVDFIINIFALWKINAIPVPLNSRLILSEIETLLSFANCRYLLIDRNFDEKFLVGGVNTISYPFSIKPDYSYKKFHAVEQNFNDTAIVMFTSGSTGNAKGVMLSFNNLLQSAVIGDQLIKHKGNDRWLASLPFYHIGGFSIIIRAVVFGAVIIIPSSIKTVGISSAIKKHKPTLASFVSTQLARLIEENLSPNKELRNILLGGGFIEESLIKNALAKGWKISKVYGSTETSSFITGLSTEEAKYKSAAAGKPLHPNQIFVLIDNEKVTEPSTDKSGEIVVKSPAVMKGYLNNDVETNAKIKNGLYQTGDIGYLDEEGYLYITSRRNDFIVSGGENVNTIEVENVLKTHKDISEVCVFPLKDEEWGDVVAAAIVASNKDITERKIKSFLKNKLAAYKIPKKVFIIEEMPKTSLGKIQRDKIRKMFN